MRGVLGPNKVFSYECAAGNYCRNCYSSVLQGRTVETAVVVCCRDVL
jgi:hypothetical protein